MSADEPGVQVRIARSKIAAVAVVLVVIASAGIAAVSRDVRRANAASGPAHMFMADPATYPAFIYPGVWIELLFGTTQQASSCTGTKIYVPYLIDAPGQINTSKGCPDGDALPGGPVWPAVAGADVWAPSVIYSQAAGKYFMFFAAPKNPASNGGLGGRCIWRVDSTAINGPYGNQAEFMCDPVWGRDIIDPDAKFDSAGNLYVAYRDDRVTGDSGQWTETAISIVPVNPATGVAILAYRRMALKSTQLGGWVYDAGSGTRIVENPSLYYDSTTSPGHWFLFYSGSAFNQPTEAIGIADCGTSPLGTTPCTPYVDANRPYFGKSNVNNPVLTLPNDFPSPGGMQIGSSVSWSNQPLFAIDRGVTKGQLIKYYIFGVS